MTDTIELIGTKEACRILNIDKATLTRWVAAGTVTAAYKLPGKNGAFLYRASDITALAATKASA